jgi:hypothetical protein
MNRTIKIDFLFSIIFLLAFLTIRFKNFWIGISLLFTIIITRIILSNYE